MKELLDMNLHEILHVHDYEILRVQGGWVYTCFRESGSGGYNLSSSFVPERR